MKNRLSFMNNDRGFFLPLVLFNITLVLIFVTTNIHSYKNDIHITDRQVEQVIIESLFQMGRERVKDELDSHEIPNKIQYTFPDGTVNITITPNNNFYGLIFSITTNNNTTYSFQNYIPKKEALTDE